MGYLTYTTTPAESVAGIAARQLKDQSKWIEIARLNSLEHPDMGPHDYYPVGTVLHMPVTEQEAVHLNHNLPPVHCPILIQVDGKLLRAERTSHITHKDDEMVYLTSDGKIITGRYPWTYP